MKISILFKLALKSMSSRKKIIFPYFLSVSLLFGLNYIMFSLLENAYIQNRHPDLRTLFGIFLFFTVVIISVISLYASRFVFQSQKKELGLYTVLGLEIKHLRLVQLVESVCSFILTSIFSVLTGYALGNLFFILLNRFMKNTGVSVMDYPFELTAASRSILILALVHLLILILNNWQLGKVTPSKMLSHASAGEKVPKGNLWIMLLGLITLGGGYYLALTTEGVLRSLTSIFLIILLLIIATFSLFTAGSIRFLNRMKSNKKHYYKTQHFLTISGMLYRMKANAVALASIAILSSGIILTLTTTFSLYRGMESQVDRILPTDYSLELVREEQHTKSTSETEDILEKALVDLKNTYPSTEGMVNKQVLTPTDLKDGEFTPLLPDQGDVEKPVYLLIQSLEDYNTLYNKSEELKDNEILMTSNLLNLEEYSEINLLGQDFQTRQISEDLVPSNFAVEAIYLVVDGEGLLEKASQYYPLVMSDGTVEPAPIETMAYFSMGSQADREAFEKNSKEILANHLVDLSTKEELQKNLYELNGGLLFIGILVSITLLIGTLLLLYYKQVSEGQSDRNNYEIMKQVGLPKEAIDKTIRSQIIWMFALPVVVGAIHVLANVKIMNQLLGALGVSNIYTYLSSLLYVSLTYGAIYYVAYWLSSRTYKAIVDGKD